MLLALMSQEQDVSLSTVFVDVTVITETAFRRLILSPPGHSQPEQILRGPDQKKLPFLGSFDQL